MLKIVYAEMINILPSSEKAVLSSELFELVFVIDGSAFLDKERKVRGDGYFLKSESVSVKPDKSVSCQIARFLIDGDDSEMLFEKSALSTSQTVSFTFDVNASSELLKILATAQYNDVSDSFKEGAAKMVLSFVKPENTSQYTPVYQNIYVDKAIRYINANVSSDLRVEGIATMLGIDRMYLRNLFAEHVGISTMDYIMNTRMERAKELLKNITMSVGDVANAVGYRDVLAFSKSFKKHVGVSPTEFRHGTKKEVPRKRDDVPIFIL